MPDTAGGERGEESSALSNCLNCLGRLKRHCGENREELVRIKNRVCDCLTLELPFTESLSTNSLATLFRGLAQFHENSRTDLSHLNTLKQALNLLGKSELGVNTRSLRVQVELSLKIMKVLWKSCVQLQLLEQTDKQPCDTSIRDYMQKFARTLCE